MFLITGGRGAVGTHLLDLLRADGHSVRGGGGPPPRNEVKRPQKRHPGPTHPPRPQ
ncbi:hypothetical protein [Nocardia brasiliensis]|uniref:hypothetical protein n=1 Tax=Nocardia brasiliensis TaxID=37326 RepID=UPI002456E97C|nr:hypothetical protein [Nocardia brasiliensis]